MRHHRREELARLRVGRLTTPLFLDVRQTATNLELGFDLMGQRFQQRDRVGFHLSGLGVQHAQRAERVAVGRTHRHPAVEAQARLTRDVRVAAKALVDRQVWHHQRRTQANGRFAKRVLARRFGRVEVDRALEQLLRFGEQRHQRNRRF